MTDSPARIVATYLVGQGIGNPGGNIDTGVFVGNEPPKPNLAVTVYDTEGEDPDTDEFDVFRRTIQIRVRDLSYDNGYTVQGTIRDLLLAQPVLANVQGVWMFGDILAIGKDDNERYLFTANYRLLMNV